MTAPKTYRVVTFLNEVQNNALITLMADAMEDNTAQYLRVLITNAYRARNEERTKRPVGRPRTTDSTPDTVPIDEPRNIPHPDKISEGNRGKFITQSEYDEWLDNHPWHKAQLLKDQS